MKLFILYLCRNVNTSTVNKNKQTNKQNKTKQTNKQTYPQVEGGSNK